MARSNRFRFALVLLALLPGLLFQGSESRSVCLHDWIDLQDGCQEEAARVQPSADSDGCCSEDEAEDERERPALAGAHDCRGCCIELGSDGAETPKLPPAAGVQDPGPAAPQHHGLARWSAPRVQRLTSRPIVPARNLPGRAPTPLRI